MRAPTEGVMGDFQSFVKEDAWCGRGGRAKATGYKRQNSCGRFGQTNEALPTECLLFSVRNDIFRSVRTKRGGES
jgi:hypothetical protein